MSTTVNTRIKLKKDTKENFDKVATTFIPLDGEVCLITTDDSVRIKVGDGVTTIGSLPYIPTQLTVDPDDGTCLVLS